jgi:hypothetical protein
MTNHPKLCNLAVRQGLSNDQRAIAHKIDEFNLSDSAKFALLQFLDPIQCGCGCALVQNGRMTTISTPEMRDRQVKEINESDIATITTETDYEDLSEQCVRYHSTITFLPV